MRARQQPPAADHDTAPLPGVTHAFAPLPVGAILGGHYVVAEIMESDETYHVYRVSDLVPVRQCPNCQAVTSDADERFCTECGTDLAAAPDVDRQYAVKERPEPQAFALEEKLLVMELEHPGLRLPLAVFTEAPYGTPRRYRMDVAMLPRRAATLPVPQDPNLVLAWGRMLAHALAHLHRHHVVLGATTPDHITVNDDHAAWMDLDAGYILMPERRRQQGEGAFAQDTHGLVTSLVYLAAGKPDQVDQLAWPAPLRSLMVEALEHPEQVTAAALAQAMEAPSASGLAGAAAAPVSLHVGHGTDVGRLRSVNEDSLRTLDLGDAYRTLGQPAGLFLVADGMGGHEAGDVASRVAAQTIADLATQELLGPVALNESERAPEMWLERAVRAANQAVYDARRAAGNDMGTTLVMALVVGPSATIANVGDSRCYHMTPRGFVQITVDHSLVERLIAIGQLTREEAERHPQRNVVYRVIGDRPELEVDLYQQRLQAGEALLLCSDGLSGMVSDDEIWRLWREAASPQAACDRLVDAANAAGGEDNITVIIVQVAAAR